MIQNLVQALATLLRNSLKDSFKAPDKQIQPGLQAAPAPDLLPFMALYTGKLTISQKAVELNAGQPRPQAGRERITITTRATQSTIYPLHRIPLEGSIHVRRVYDEGKRTERTVTLVEKQDFTVDYTKGSLKFTQPLPRDSVVLVQFSFAGIFTLKEFTQDLLIDVYAANGIEVEQSVALVMAAVLTSQADLIEQYNNQSGYSGGPFESTSTLSQISLLEIVPDPAATPLTARLHFQVQGQLKLTRELSDSAALIKKVHSPGQVSDFPVDVDIMLG